MTGWLDPQRVASALGLTVEQGGQWLADACAATEAYVAHVRGDLFTPDGAPVTDPLPADVLQGATLYAVTSYRRRDTFTGAANTLDGLGTLGVLGVMDPAVDQLLGVGRYRRPSSGVVG